MFKNINKTDTTVTLRMLATEAVKCFPKEANVRDINEDYDKDGALAQQIIETGKVTNPIQVGVVGITSAQFMKMKDEEKRIAILGEQGFRRTHGLCEILKGAHDFRFDNASTTVEEYLPVIVNFRSSLRDVITARQDHSSVKGLNEVELGNCLRECMTGLEAMTNKECVWRLRHLFEANAAQSKVTELRNRLDEKVNRATWASPADRLDAEKEITMRFWYGKFQELQRIYMPENGTEVLANNHADKVYGRPYVPIVKGKLSKLHKLDPAELKQALLDIVESKSGTRTETVKAWTQKKTEEMFSTLKDNPITSTVLGSVLQREESKAAWVNDMPLIKKLGQAMLKNRDALEAAVDKLV